MRIYSYFTTLLTLIIFLTAPVPAAVRDTLQIKSQAMDKELPVLVVVADKAKESAQKIPAVYLLHGYGGDFLSWSRQVDLGFVADEHGVILVCPDGSKNSWYLDSPVDPESQYETFISQELVAWIDDHYPAIAEKSGRAIGGLSMGGFGALYIAFRHPDLFGAASSMSGVVDLTATTQPQELAKKLGDMSQHVDRWKQNSVVNMGYLLRDKNLPLLIDCGVNDIFIESNREMHIKLLRLRVPHDYVERPGGHEWSYWRRVLKYHLLFFDEYFNSHQPGMK